MSQKESPQHRVPCRSSGTRFVCDASGEGQPVAGGGSGTEPALCLFRERRPGVPPQAGSGEGWGLVKIGWVFMGSISGAPSQLEVCTSLHGSLICFHKTIFEAWMVNSLPSNFGYPEAQSASYAVPAICGMKGPSFTTSEMTSDGSPIVVSCSK